MELAPFFKSIVEQDRAAIVVCDLEHTIIYMNPAGKAYYAKWGGEALLGRSLLDCHNERSREIINAVISRFAESGDNDVIFTYHNPKQNKDVYMVALRDASGRLIGYYEKHEYRNAETAKAFQMRN